MTTAARRPTTTPSDDDDAQPQTKCFFQEGYLLAVPSPTLALQALAILSYLLSYLLGPARPFGTPLRPLLKP